MLKNASFFAALLFCAVVVTAGFTACGGNGAAPTTTNANTMPAEEGGNADKPTTNTNANTTNADSRIVHGALTVGEVKTAADLTGYYNGKFGENRITIEINTVNGTAVKGRSIVAGNDRPFEGTLTQNGKDYTVEAKEPGTDAHDGTFRFHIAAAGKPTDKLAADGTWEAFKKTAKSDKKTFHLEKREFRYDPKLGMFSEASTRLLTEKDVENRTKDDIRQMRNEIYARHGYSFKLKDMRATFDQEDWYMPMTTDVRTALSDTERKNEALLKRYEKFAADHYDEFGR